MTEKWDKKWLTQNEKPKRIQPDLKTAAQEAIRLATQYAGQFAIYECIGFVETTQS